MAWKDGFVIEYVPRKRKRKKTIKSMQQSAIGTRKSRGPLTVDKWVESPERGKGKVFAIDGEWVSVEYTKTSTRKRYNLGGRTALESGKLRRL